MLTQLNVKSIIQEVRIFKAVVTKIEDEYIYVKIPEFDKEIKCNVVLSPALSQSQSAFSPLRPEINDEVFVMFEDGKEQSPVILMLGRNYFKEFDEKTSFVRSIKFKIINKNQTDSSENFALYDFENNQYHFKLQNTYFKMDLQNIELNTTNYKRTTQTENINTQTCNFQGNLINIIGSGPTTVKGNPLNLVGTSMALTLNRGRIAVPNGKVWRLAKSKSSGFNFNPDTGELDVGEIDYYFIEADTNGTGEIRFFSEDGNTDDHLVRFSELKAYLDDIANLINTIISKFNSHTHVGVKSGGDTSGVPSSPISSSADPTPESVKTEKLKYKAP